MTWITICHQFAPLLGYTIQISCLNREFGAFTREFRTFTREFRAFTREFRTFTREFGAFTREFRTFTREFIALFTSEFDRYYSAYPGIMIPLAKVESNLNTAKYPVRKEWGKTHSACSCWIRTLQSQAADNIETWWVYPDRPFLFQEMLILLQKMYEERSGNRPLT
nr:hypothetical protein [Bacillus sp. ISL-101]